MTDRVRALLITPDDYLLTIERVRPGRDTYWVLPGGGVEAGEDLETRGEYHLRAIPLTARALAAIDLKPGPLAELLLGHLRAGTDLFSLPDLRASMAGQP